MKRCKAAVAILIAAGACSCGDPPKVVQGTVVSFQPEHQTVVVVDSEPPNAELTFSVRGAEIGADPAPKDVVRIAYRQQQGSNVAIRLMNITRQAEVRSSGAH